MNEAEFTEVLQYLQEQMRRYGLPDLNDRIIADLRVEVDREGQGEPRRPSALVLRYLDLLESELRLGTDATVRQVVGRFREVVRTESRRPVDGLTLIMSETDRELFGVEEVDLGVTSDLQRILDDVRRLRALLAESRTDE